MKNQKNIINNMKYYISVGRFNTIKVENKQKLGIIRSTFEKQKCIIGKSRTNDWFYIIDDGRMTYYWCHK